MWTAKKPGAVWPAQIALPEWHGAWSCTIVQRRRCCSARPWVGRRSRREYCGRDLRLFMRKGIHTGLLRSFIALSLGQQRQADLSVDGNLSVKNILRSGT